MDSLSCTRVDFVYSIAEYDTDYVILKYPYNEQFGIFVKDTYRSWRQQLKWESFQKGWLFHKYRYHDLLDCINASFPEWTNVHKELEFTVLE